MKKAYIGFGSNIEPRKQYLDDAIRLLKQSGGITVAEKSPIYETDPVDYLDQADFLNMVVGIETTLAPDKLLEVCQGIERDIGRVRTINKGPRKIDLDILLYEDEEVRLEKLKIPHPSLHERAFVLVPLSKIAPGAVHPVYEQSIRTLLNKLPVHETSGVKQWVE